MVHARKRQRWTKRLMELETAQKLTFREDEGKPGVLRAVWDGGPFTVVRYHYAAGSSFPVHRHDAAQITIVISGAIVFHVSGSDSEVGQGEAFYIPGGLPHSADVPAAGPALSLNIFHPPRKDHP